MTLITHIHQPPMKLPAEIQTCHNLVDMEPDKKRFSLCLYPQSSRGFRHFPAESEREGGCAQVVAVLAHELGHWKLGHTKALMALQQVVALSQFMLFAVVRSSPHLLSAFGFSTRRPVIVSLLLFSMVSGPLDKLIGWLFNLLSRRCDLRATRLPAVWQTTAEVF